ncbi:MAG: hypothetical protein LQ342_008277 [Letrouitia transgressa]|nr:MAG: hypothetical protein LQ342_008277 [Letrouitia transgressa]
MTTLNSKKRKNEASANERPTRPKKPKKSIKKYQYNSSSDSDSEKSPKAPTAPDLESQSENLDDFPNDDSRSTSPFGSSDSDTLASKPSNNDYPKKRKRNDPDAFSASISSILNSKLSTQKRADPILSRSATAALANAERQESKLEAKARQKLKAENKELLDKGRVKDVLLGSDAMGAGAGEGIGAVMSAGEIMEEERKLKKIAQRGVVKLFNAVREAQVKAENARTQDRVIGVKRREERVGEMSKKGFLDYIASGGKAGGKQGDMEIEEA